MRILHVIPAIAARYGGPSTVALETCRRLRARGHRVTLATTDADGPGRLDVALGDPVEYDGVPVVFFGRTSSEAFKWSPRLASWLDRSVAAYDVVDIHAIFSHSSLAAGRACRASGVPYVVRPHGSLDPWSLKQRRWEKQLLFWLGARRLLTGAASVQYTAEEERRLAESVLPWPMRGAVVPLGVPADVLSAAAGEPAAPPYVVALSRLDRKKGLEGVIAAFHHVAIASHLLGWRLVIAGTGNPGYVRDLQRLAASGPAAARIDFPGWVSGSAKTALIAGASLLVSPSAQENFGLSVVEAMAAGVPVLVSTGVNLGPDIAAAGAGWVVDPDPRSFSHVLESILSDRSGRSTRGRAARVLARRFGWDRSIDALEALYTSVARPHGGGIAA